jgi:hypothetical protein
MSQYNVVDVEIESLFCPFQLYGTTDNDEEVYVRERFGHLRVEINGEIIYQNDNVPDFSGYLDLKRLTSHLIR